MHCQAVVVCAADNTSWSFVAKGLHYFWNKKWNTDGEYNTWWRGLIALVCAFTEFSNPNIVKHVLHVWLISTSRVMQMILLLWSHSLIEGRIEKLLQLPTYKFEILWSSGEGQARIGKGWPLRRKASKLKPEPRAYTKVGCHPPPPPTRKSHYT